MVADKLNRDDPKKHAPQDVVMLVDDILDKAVQSGASDVHFEPGENNMTIKYRLDGVLNTIEKLPVVISDNIISRLKVLAGLLTYRNDIPQEGRIDIAKIGNGRVTDKRLAIFPTIHGQRAVVRLFYKQEKLADLEQLGFEQNHCKVLKKLASSNQGLLLFTGPAGSGKSTTLAALLRYILKTYPGKSIVTLEDPVEIHVEGATQVQIPPHGDMTFPVALRSLLRQDPQVLMIGEIRDAETAKIAVEAGLTGHFLMSTMHSGTPTGALLRLLEMGIEPYQVTSSVTAVVNQRLVRKLCSNCKKQNDVGLYEPAGCDNCLNTGYKGRALIAEIVQLNSELRKAILNKSDIEELESLLKQRKHISLADNGRRIVESGQTSQQELNTVCPVSEN